ncbi:MarR family winged helix-turn-helix transcriptional regulator [Methylovirgula sp. 4M-Z18]|uniref:MarR family winged helix-turn-helix transcriptional regulator n=1 Tax=Methylovirgula sp. 4M-Z18 TaxID=2293567 RepID=UPI000E2F1488|nr:MarR family transcriptional regulator [Methylovirgula sp. 4M-Z18]RFB79886.1 MarR family transcriptional regulator [Methylovirgula sp. 4M-Z18]
MSEAARPLSDIDYRTLAEFRYALRKFLAFSEAAAKSVGLTAQQHQALLALRGFAKPGACSIGDLAERLMIRHHSTVELVDRLEKLWLVERHADAADGRKILVHITPAGEARLQELSAIHLEELRAVGPSLAAMLQTLV